MDILKQSTAASIVMGPMLNDADGNTPETTLTIAQADIRVSKNGGVYAQSNNAIGATHMEFGKYSVPLDNVDTATLGKVRIDIHKSGALAVWREFTVVPADVYNSLVLGTDVLHADVTQWLGTAAATPSVAGVPEVDLTHCGGSAVAAGAIPNAAADAAGGLPISDAGGLDLDTKLANTHEITVARMGALTDWLNGERLDLLIDQILADTNELQTDDIPGKLLAYVQLLARSDAAIATDNATELTAINADGGSGGGDFSNQTDGQEAIRDRGDTAWITATGFSTHAAADIWSVATRALTDKSGFALSATGANLILKDSTFALAMADAIWDEILTGATHNITTSAGRRVREVGAYAIHAGTAQAGNSHTITLAASASANDGVYNRNLIILTDNIGVGQTRTIVDYDGATKIAVIDRDWRTSPDATTAYQITPDNTPLVVDQGVAQEGTSTTIKLRAYASSANDIYLCNVVAIIAGTGRGQARLVGSYDGTSKVVTICGDNWVTNPDNTSVYVLMPYGTTCTSCIGTYARGQINTECDTAITDYDPPTRAEATTDKEEIITEVDANETKIDLLQIDSTSIKSKTDNLPSGIGKNEALAKFDVFMVLSSDHVTGATGKTVTGAISKDGGAFAAITNAITEVSHGMYTIASGFTQTEMNADTVTLKFTADDCDVRIITIHTS